MDMRLITPLSHTQLQILRLVNVGHSNRQIADELGITVATTKWHLYHVFSKLYVKNRSAAAARGRQLGLL
jgi:DNA-binding CsgD family transcriptional regulator